MGRRVWKDIHDRKQGGKANPFKGRDHHVSAFTIWMAGGGIKKGYTHGETDEIGYYPISGAVTPADDKPQY